MTFFPDVEAVNYSFHGLIHCQSGRNREKRRCSSQKRRFAVNSRIHIFAVIDQRKSGAWESRSVSSEVVASIRFPGEPGVLFIKAGDRGGGHGGKHSCQWKGSLFNSPYRVI